MAPQKTMPNVYGSRGIQRGVFDLPGGAQEELNAKALLVFGALPAVRKERKHSPDTVNDRRKAPANWQRRCPGMKAELEQIQKADKQKTSRVRQHAREKLQRLKAGHRSLNSLRSAAADQARLPRPALGRERE